jgi:hypothetical protein
MKIVVPALAAAFMATIGAGSAAQAAVIDFSVAAIAGSSLSYTSGSTLDGSTAFDFDGSPLVVTGTGPGDMSGLTPFAFPTSPNMFVTLSPTDIVYDHGTLASDITKMWTAASGDVFTEKLTKVTEIDRSTPNAITVTLTGTVSDMFGLFTDAPIKFIMSANQSAGPGTTIAAGFTNSTTAVPEPATWVMLALGFAGLGYAAVRRSAKDKAAIAV